MADSFLKRAAWAGLHFIGLITLYILWRALTHQPLFLPEAAFSRLFDAIYYNEIAHKGYTYLAGKQSNVAFFPGFPLLWKITLLNGYGIALMNIAMFYASLCFLAGLMKFTRPEMLLILSLPSMMFMYVPYSEALFFLTCSLIIYGLLKEKVWIAATGIFLSCFVRSAGNIFIPAIILMEILSLKGSFRSALLYCVSAGAAIWLAACIQYEQTGVLWGFISAQKYWGHWLRLPYQPFSTWGKVLLLDAAAFLAGSIFISAVLWHIYRFVFRGCKVENRAYLFSILCLSGWTLFAVFFKGGSLYSLNRYLIPTAFFITACVTLLRKFHPARRLFLPHALLMLLFFLVFFHFYLHILLFAGFFALTIYLSLYIVFAGVSLKGHKVLFIIIYALNIIIQVYLLNGFMNRMWVG